MKIKQEIMGNHPWRIESEEEKELAIAADDSIKAKEAYVEYYHQNMPSYHEKGIMMINKTIDLFRGKDINDTQRQHYILDMLYSLHRFGCMYDEYFLMNFEYLNANGRNEFITDKNRWDYYAILNGTKYDKLFKNKSETYQTFSKYYHRDLLQIQSEADYKDFCDFRRKNKEFIVKPSLGSGGRGVYIDKSTDQDHRTSFNRVLQVAPAVVEGLIISHPKLKEFHPNSVNTLRIPTIRYSDGTVKVFHPFLRIGVGDSVVDNALSGGIFAPVEPESGIISQKGITEKGVYHFRHPESGIVLPGFQIPEYREVVNLVKELADVIPECRYVGWDCALTEQGWIMVEGNLYGQFVDQYATKQGIKRELDHITNISIK